MPNIVFMPMNLTVEVESGKTLLDGALKSDVPLQHACGGVCACSTCHVIVKSGDPFLSEMRDDEEDQLDEARGLTLHSRLGCQSKVFGDVVVEIVNLEER
jgi:2Fe-2S ferredoxin